MTTVAFGYECGCSIVINAVAPEVSTVRCKEHSARVLEADTEQLDRHKLADQVQELILQLHVEREERAAQDLLINGLRKLMREHLDYRSIAEREANGDLE